MSGPRQTSILNSNEENRKGTPMEDLLLRQLEARKQRRPYAVATIVEATGSTPRTEGKMLV